MQQVIAIATLVIVAAIIADLVIHPAGTGALVNGLGGLWRTSINGALGQTS